MGAWRQRTPSTSQVSVQALVLGAFLCLTASAWRPSSGSGLEEPHEAWDRGYLRTNLRERYEYLSDYEFGSCGKLEWIDIEANGADSPPKAVVAGKDKIIQEKLYVCRVRDSGTSAATQLDNALLPGKTWFHRTDSCCNSVNAGDARVVTGSSCQVLTVKPRAMSGSKLAWERIFPGENQHRAPDGAITMGNHPTYGNLFSCRIRDDKGDWMNGNTWFPRLDGSCCSAEFGDGERRGSTCEVLVEKRC